MIIELKLRCQTQLKIIKAIYLRNILPEAIVAPNITMGVKWAVENIKLTKFYT